MKVDNLKHKKFGRLTVIERAENNKIGGARWKCLCECGNAVTVSAGDLKRGHTQSCGCYQIESTAQRSTKHGGKHTRLYRIWEGMKTRCYRNSCTCSHRYKGRGITVCDEWINDFSAFQTWAISNGYSDDLSIDRVNNDGNYEPGNCRWATNQEQAQNKANSRRKQNER